MELKMKTRKKIGVLALHETMIPLRRHFRYASVIFVEVDVVEAVSELGSHSPFKIIKHGPVQVSFHFHTIPTYYINNQQELLQTHINKHN